METRYCGPPVRQCEEGVVDDRGFSLGTTGFCGVEPRSNFERHVGLLSPRAVPDKGFGLCSENADVVACCIDFIRCLSHTCLGFAALLPPPVAWPEYWSSACQKCGRQSVVSMSVGLFEAPHRGGQFASPGLLRNYFLLGFREAKEGA